MTRRLLIALLLSPLALQAQDTLPVPTQRVGLPLTLTEIYIPGTALKAKPRRDREPPLVVRILEVKPAKDGSRYDFEVQGLEAGRHNLSDYLEPTDGSAAAELPEIPLEITSALPAGLSYPNKIERGELPKLGGYRTTMTVLGGIWLAGLGAILIWKKKKPADQDQTNTPQASLAERLRPLVDEASKGKLTPDDRARLERLVIGHWRERLPEVAALSPAEAMTKLRTDPQASPLILALERWLHAPSSSTSQAEIEKLLSPYAASI